MQFTSLERVAGWAAVIFFCELSNALRTSAQMPGFNKLVPEPRIARRYFFGFQILASFPDNSFTVVELFAQKMCQKACHDQLSTC